MKVHKAIPIAFYALLVALLLIAANYAAGALLFLFYKEDPSNTTFWTIQEAWSLDPDKATRKKILGSMFLGLALCLGGPFALICAARRNTKDLFGTARFATSADLKKERLDSPHGILLGKLGNQLVRLPGYEFALLAAPTRTGKGVGFVIPNLLTFPESTVVLDIKGENYTLTSEFRRRFMGNEIIYWNPFSETTHRWNPLSYVSHDACFRISELQTIAAIIYPPNEKEPFWVDSAKNLFVGLALMILETPALPKTFGEILRQGSGKGQQVTDYLRHIMAVRAASAMPLSPACIDALNRFLNNSENTLKGILASFIAPLSMWSNPVIDKATSNDDFDLRDVRKRKMSIYLCIPAGDVLNASFLLNLFFSQLINENLKEQPQDNPELKYQCLLMMDEFTSMGKIGIIAKGVGYMASYNLRLAIVIQDRTQLESVYGREDAHNIVINMGAKIYFTPAEEKEAKEYSEMIGYQTREGKSRQHSNIGAFNPGRTSLSETESEQRRALMLPQELRAMDKSKQLIMRAGIPVVMADKVSYFKDPYFNERFTAVPSVKKTVNGELRDIPIATKLPPTNWRRFRDALAQSNYYLSGEFEDLDTSATDLDSDSLLEILNADKPESDLAEIEAAASQLAVRKVEEFLSLLEREHA